MKILAVIMVIGGLGYYIVTDPYSHSAYLTYLERCANESDDERLGLINSEYTYVPITCAMSHGSWVKVMKRQAEFREESLKRAK